MGRRGNSGGIAHRVPDYENAAISEAKIMKYCLDLNKNIMKSLLMSVIAKMIRNG